MTLIKRLEELARDLRKATHNLIVSNYLTEDDIAECVDSLKKQMPKKPLNMGQFMWDYPLGNCPSCEEGVNGGMDYCDRCGQKLDWRENNT